MQDIFFIYSSADKHLDCELDTVISVAIKMGMQGSSVTCHLRTFRDQGLLL